MGIRMPDVFPFFLFTSMYAERNRFLSGSSLYLHPSRLDRQNTCHGRSTRGFPRRSGGRRDSANAQRREAASASNVHGEFPRRLVSISLTCLFTAFLVYVPDAILPDSMSLQ